MSHTLPASEVGHIMLQSQPMPSNSDPNDLAEQPRLDVPQSARERTLAVVELLEKILKQLEPLQIVRAQRVCAHWHSVVAGSSLLKKRAFLVTDDQLPGLVLKEGCHQLHDSSPQGAFFGPVDLANNELAWMLRLGPDCLTYSKECMYLEGMYNRSLLHIKPWPARSLNQYKIAGLIGPFHRWIHLDPNFVKRCLYQPAQPKGGFQDMLLCQPAPFSADVLVEFRHATGNEHTWSHTVRRAGGVRFRDVVNSLRVRIRRMKKTEARHIHTVSVELVAADRVIVFAPEEIEEKRGSGMADGGVCKRTNRTAQYRATARGRAAAESRRAAQSRTTEQSRARGLSSGLGIIKCQLF